MANPKTVQNEPSNAVGVLPGTRPGNELEKRRPFVL